MNGLQILFIVAAVITVVYFIYKIIKNVWNRPNAEVTIPIVTEDVITLSITNKGRSTIKLLGAYFKFSDGWEFGHSYVGSNIFPIDLYRTRGIAIDFETEIIRDILKKNKTKIKCAYFIDENKNKYEISENDIPPDFKDIIYR